MSKTRSSSFELRIPREGVAGALPVQLPLGEDHSHCYPEVIELEFERADGLDRWLNA
jgi:hypothetical protein